MAAQTIKIYTLIEQLASDSYAERSAAIRALTQIGLPAVHPLLEALHDSRRIVRLSAIQILGDIGDLSVVRELLVHVRGMSVQEQLAIVRVFQRIGHDAVQRLVEICRHDDEPTVRADAAYALGEIGDAGGLPALDAALDDRFSFVRVVAASALSKIDSPAVFGPLVKALRDPHLTVQLEAALGLGLWGDVRAVDVLVDALRGELLDGRYRHILIEALATIDDPRAREELVDVIYNEQTEVELLHVVIAALRKKPDVRILDALVYLLESRWYDNALITPLIEHFCELETSDVLPVLRRVVVQQWGDDGALIAAARRISGAGDPADIPALVALIESGYVTARADLKAILAPYGQAPAVHLLAALPEYPAVVPALALCANTDWLWRRLDHEVGAQRFWVAVALLDQGEVAAFEALAAELPALAADWQMSPVFRGALIRGGVALIPALEDLLATVRNPALREDVSYALAALRR